MLSLLHATCTAISPGTRLLNAQPIRAKCNRERRVGNFAMKFIPDPRSFNRWPSCSISRSTSSAGSGCFILGPNLDGPADTPGRVLSFGGSRAWYGDFQALELVSDLRPASSEFVIEADREIGPGLSVGRGLCHTIWMPAPLHRVKLFLWNQSGITRVRRASNHVRIA